MIDRIDYLASKHTEPGKAIDAHGAALGELQAAADLLPTMRGCGRIPALAATTGLPEPGSLDRRRVAVLGGPAPIPEDGGLSDSQRVTKAGRGQVRQVLHMATVSATRVAGNPFEARYRAFAARGKPKETRHHRCHARNDRHRQRHGRRQRAVESAARRPTQPRLLANDLFQLDV